MVGSILYFVVIISAVIWLVLLFMPIRWSISERWDISGDLPTIIPPWPTLSVIVPARNERPSLPVTLPSWLKQDYPASEIILVDDESCDGTAECAREISAQLKCKIQVLAGTPPPPGWTGKLWALEQGVRISSGEWLLFTDADIFHNPHLWQGLIAKAIAEQREMVSLMVLLDTQGFWARLLIPAFIYFFHFLYPFAEVQDWRSRTAAAAGGCILVSRKALNAIGGIASYGDAWIDDIALALRVKRAGMPISLSLTKSAISIRPYLRLHEIWNMVARKASFAGHSLKGMPPGHTTFNRCIRYGPGHIFMHLFIKYTWYDVVLREVFRLNSMCNSVCCCHIHGISDCCCPTI
ncbi:MAG: glycosyl transferase family 2 [Candidatus Brocadia sp. WS118]|nr:MAG: glycosyl transferase family 2 [Candidatus Brocadia sp. WS118]